HRRVLPARHNAGEVFEVRIDIERDAMEGDPVPHADADRGDLRAADEDADLISMAVAFDAEGGKRSNQPVLQSPHEGPDVATVPVEVAHHIGDALSRAVIGVPAAAAGREYGEAVWVEKVLCRRAGSRRIDWWMLQ